MLIENQRFMSFFVFKISISNNSHNIRYNLSTLIDIIFFYFTRIKRIFRHNHIHSSSKTLKSRPYFIILDQWKNLLIGYSIHISEDKKFFVILYQLSNILTEKRKRRIRHYNICLFHDFNTRIGAKISTTIFPISLQRRNGDILLILSNQSFYILQIKRTIFIFITHAINFDLIGFICYFFIPINLQQWQLRSRNR